MNKKSQFYKFINSRKPQKVNNTVIIEPNYWIMYYGIAIPLNNYLSSKLFEYNYVKIKEETTSNELEFTDDGLKALRFDTR